jgi:hypothetical protein
MPKKPVPQAASGTKAKETSIQTKHASTSSTASTSATKKNRVDDKPAMEQAAVALDELLRQRRLESKARKVSSDGTPNPEEAESPHPKRKRGREVESDAGETASDSDSMKPAANPTNAPPKIAAPFQSPPSALEDLQLLYPIYQANAARWKETQATPSTAKDFKIRQERTLGAFFRLALDCGCSETHAALFTKIFPIMFVEYLAAKKGAAAQEKKGGQLGSISIQDVVQRTKVLGGVLLQERVRQTFADAFLGFKLPTNPAPKLPPSGLLRANPMEHLGLHLLLYLLEKESSAQNTLKTLPGGSFSKTAIHARWDPQDRRSVILALLKRALEEKALWCKADLLAEVEPAEGEAPMEFRSAPIPPIPPIVQPAADAAPPGTTTLPPTGTKSGQKKVELKGKENIPEKTTPISAPAAHGPESKANAKKPASGTSNSKEATPVAKVVTATTPAQALKPNTTTTAAVAKGKSTAKSAETPLPYVTHCTLKYAEKIGVPFLMSIQPKTCGIFFADGACGMWTKGNILSYVDSEGRYFTIRPFQGDTSVIVPKHLQSRFTALLWTRDLFANTKFHELEQVIPCQPTQTMHHPALFSAEMWGPQLAQLQACVKRPAVYHRRKYRLMKRGDSLVDVSSADESSSSSSDDDDDADDANQAGAAEGQTPKDPNLGDQLVSVAAVAVDVPTSGAIPAMASTSTPSGSIAGDKKAPPVVAILPPPPVYVSGFTQSLHIAVNRGKGKPTSTSNAGSPSSSTDRRLPVFTVANEPQLLATAQWVPPAAAIAASAPHH